MDTLYIFLVTCTILSDIIDKQDICEGVEPPIVEQYEKWDLGTYHYEDSVVAIRKGLPKNVRDRVLAHEFAHHILHVTRIAPVDIGNEKLCLGEVYAHEVTMQFALMHDDHPSPGEVDWLPRYPHCHEYVDGSNANP